MSVEFTPQELKALKEEYAAQATDSQFTLWIETCKRRGLVPVEDVVLQIRSSKEYDEEARAKVYKKKVIFITTLRALLKLAERTGKYKGFVSSQYIYLDDKNQPTVVSEYPLPDPKHIDRPLIPWAARVGVKRAGFDDTQFEIARFWAYAQTYNDGETKKLNSTWLTRGPEQLVKCARAAALRSSFPEELGGLFLEEEIQNSEEKTEATTTTTAPAAKSTAPAPAPALPKVNNAPAEGKANPRPGEEPAKATDGVPYTPPLTVADKIEHTKQVNDALNAATEPPPAPVVPEKAPEKAAAKSSAKKSRAPKKAASPEPAATPAAAETATPALASDEPRLPQREEFEKILTEFVTFRDRVGGAGSDGSKQLKEFLHSETGQESTKTITVQQWEAIFKKLRSALDDKDLKVIINTKREA